MDKHFVLFPYKETSGGSKMMASALKVNRVLREDRFDPVGLAVTAINWGRGDWPHWKQEVVKFLNSPDAVIKAINKVTSFRFFDKSKVPHAPWTTTVKTAQEWLEKGNTVFVRKETEGKDAAGIELVQPGQVLPNAPLYTMYVPVVREYRVHVMNGECFYSNVKTEGARNAKNGRSKIIRSGSYGWYFSHMDNLPEESVCKAAVMAVEALGLDFGGVDVGITDAGDPVVYEVNTAPEMGPNTTAAYLRAFKKHYGDYKNNENLPIKNL
jgi:hypothetical protein